MSRTYRNHGSKCVLFNVTSESDKFIKFYDYLKEIMKFTEMLRIIKTKTSKKNCFKIFKYFC